MIVIDGESDMPRKKQRKKPTPPWPVGTVIRKSFPQGDFIGQVISYNKCVLLWAPRICESLPVAELLWRVLCLLLASGRTTRSDTRTKTRRK